MPQTGIEPLRMTTLIDTIVQRSANVVASRTKTIGLLPFSQKRTIQLSKGAKHVVTSTRPSLVSTPLFRIQLPLAQALKHRLFLLFQHQRKPRTDLRLASMTKGC